MKWPYLIAAACCLLCLSCVKKEIDFEALRARRDYSLEIAKDVRVEYSDSSYLRAVIEGSTLTRYIYKYRVEEEFPDGIHVEFYDESQHPNAWLDAKYAIRKPNEKIVIARDSVVLFNTKGEKLEAPELIWNEKTKMISTDRFVRITRPDEIIYSRGFRTNQEFTNYTLHKPEGNITFTMSAEHERE